MEKSFIFFTILLVTFKIVSSRPFPQLEDNDDEELLSGKDTRYYGFPLFWFGRPFYDDDEDYAGNGGQNSELNRRSSTVSYAHVGAGWGR